MRKLSSIALACVLAISSITTANAQSIARKMSKPVTGGSGAFTVQTASVRTGCFDGELKGILAHIKAATGRTPIVTSGFRPHASRAHSEHRNCDAADIRVPGVSDRKVVAAAQSAPGIGGIGTYCNGIIHVDTGERRRWVDC